MKKKINLLKITLVTLVVIILIGIFIYLWPLMKNLTTLEGKISFQQKIKQTGLLGMLLLFGLQLAQIFLIILPGEPIEMVAGMCYGGIGGTLFILISSCIMSSFIFLLVRKFGKKFIYYFWDQKKIDKIENSKLFKNPHKIEFIMFILFFIPGTPKDLLVYIGGLLPIRPLRFIFISTFARIPSVISSTIAGEHLINRKLENRNFILCDHYGNCGCNNVNH